MATYSLWVMGESQLSITGGVSLDGVNQGDGSHLLGESITINSGVGTEVFIRDAGWETNFGDSDFSQRLDGTQTIDGATYNDGTNIEAEYQFVLRDPATGLEYRVVGVNILNSRPSYGTVEALAFVGALPPTGVALEVIQTDEGPRNFGAGAIDIGEFTPVCFARDTLILTRSGMCPVQDLQPGTWVETCDGAAQLRRVLASPVPASAMRANPKLRPIRITAGALGAGVPERDLLVSRQHRILVDSRIAERMFGTREVLIAAIRLIALPGIFIDDAAQGAEYFHLLFDDHQIVFADGAPAESLYLGPGAMGSVSDAAWEEITTLFPQVLEEGFVPQSARPIPAGPQQKQLIQRHLKNQRALVA